MEKRVLTIIDHAVLGTGVGVIGGLLLSKFLPKNLQHKLDRDEIKSAEDLANRQRNFSESMFDPLEE